MKKIVLSFIALTVLILAGCVSQQQDLQRLGNFTPEAEAEARVMAENHVKTFVEAFQKNDVTLFLREIPKTAKRRPTQEQFNDFVTKMSLKRGKLIGYSEVGVLNQTLCRDYLWRLSFEKTTGSSKLYHNEVIYLVRIAIAGNKPEIFSFGIQN